MGKKLLITPQELEALHGITLRIPEPRDPRKDANFRRVAQIALKPYGDGIQVFLTVLQEDAKKFTEAKKAKEFELKDAKKEDKKKLEKEIEELQKALTDIDVDYQTRLKAYQEEHATKTEITFNEDDFDYMVNSLSENAKVLFKEPVLDKTGKPTLDEKGEFVLQYNPLRADAFFNLLDSAV